MPLPSESEPLPITSGVILLTTKTWAPFTITDSVGGLIWTSATEIRSGPPPYITSLIPSITYMKKMAMTVTAIAGAQIVTLMDAEVTAAVAKQAFSATFALDSSALTVLVCSA